MNLLLDTCYCQKPKPQVRNAGPRDPNSEPHFFGARRSEFGVRDRCKKNFNSEIPTPTAERRNTNALPARSPSNLAGIRSTNDADVPVWRLSEEAAGSGRTGGPACSVSGMHVNAARTSPSARRRSIWLGEHSAEACRCDAQSDIVESIRIDSNSTHSDADVRAGDWPALRVQLSVLFEPIGGRRFDGGPGGNVSHMFEHDHHSDS